MKNYTPLPPLDLQKLALDSIDNFHAESLLAWQSGFATGIEAAGLALIGDDVEGWLESRFSRDGCGEVFLEGLRAGIIFGRLQAENSYSQTCELPENWETLVNQAIRDTRKFKQLKLV